MSKHTIILAAIIGLVFALAPIAGTAQAALIWHIPTAVMPGTQEQAPATNLWDGRLSNGLTEAHIGTVVPAATVGGQYYGGLGDYVRVFLDYGSTISADSLVFVQRVGQTTMDKVSPIDVWLSDTDFGGSLPGGAADATVTPSMVDGYLVQKLDFGSTISGRYVALKLYRGPGMHPNSNNGATELVLTVIPEPATMALLGLGGLGLLLKRRRR